MRATLFVLAIKCCLFSNVLCQFDPHFYGNRSTIVHLFEWKWYDIAQECERFLQHKGYGGVQISPPNENIIIQNRPWWERYQPVSYIINTRSGDETAFKNMTKRCNDVGVRIYVDAVINHMAATNGEGVSGSTSDWSGKKFPAVPYGPNDFHDNCGISNYEDPVNVRECELESLRDLDHGKLHVRQKVVEYMNHLIDLGVAGFRIDAAKHMWPSELRNIIGDLKYLNTDYGFSPRKKPFVYQEVIYHGGPPQDSNHNLISPKINSDETCGNGYICEHRWRQISNMVSFRNIVKDAPVTNWWSNGDQQIAFCRGNKGFVAFTNWGDLKQNLQTCLPSGKYCDIISGELVHGSCSGKIVEVDGNGRASISMLSGDKDGVIAIHENSRID
ncbi:hypothetical protein JTB14_028909 [Gonioctena quinquepunctata]|nr:hypothetical protein JTB14_028909 [Gonioctena quinquepunctata]